MKISIKRLFIGYYKFCQCGCKELIPCINKMGRFAKYKNGHVVRNRIRKTGPDNPIWKGRSNQEEYIIIYKPSYKYSNKIGYVREHCYIMYIYLSILNGKPTYIEGFDVHHKNGIRDNRIENLQLLTKSEHGKMHFFHLLKKD